MRTKEWLKKKRIKYCLTQRELANAIKVSPYTIEQIEQGRRLGSADTWKKIEEYFGGEIKEETKISYASDDLIEELKQDIEEFGEEEACILIYKIIGNQIIFTNYGFITNEEPFNSKGELEDGEAYIETTLKYALEVFEKQNNIF